MEIESEVVREADSNSPSVRRNLRVAQGIPKIELFFECTSHCPSCGAPQPPTDVYDQTLCCGVTPCSADEDEWLVGAGFRACCEGILARKGMVLNSIFEAKGEDDQKVSVLDRATWMRERRKLRKRLDSGKISEIEYKQKLKDLGEAPEKGEI